MIGLRVTEELPYDSYEPLTSARFQSRLYLSWDVQPEPVDSGVPSEIAKVVACSLATYKVVFLGGSAEKLARNRWISVSEKTFAAATGGKISRLCLSSDGRVIETLFNQTGFDWSQRGQLALLLSAETDMANLSPDKLADAISSEQIDEIAGLVGYLRPGDDGDFAEFGFKDSGARFNWLDRLKEAASKAGISLTSGDTNPTNFKSISPLQ